MTEALQKDTVLQGLALSKGVAVARVCRLNQKRHSNLEIYKVSGEGIDYEIARFDRAVSVSSDRLERVRQETEATIGAPEAEIFSAHKMVLADPSLRNKVTTLIREKGINAEGAVAEVLDSYEARLRKVEDEYLRDRASDFAEIKGRLLDVLANINPEFQCGGEHHCQRGRNRIVVADELTPRMTMELDGEHIMGFVTEHGGVNSHAAILARALGIPAVSGISGAHRILKCGTELVVDGAAGKVIVNPGEETLQRVRKDSTKIRAPGPIGPVSGIEVMANISVWKEADDAVAMKAEGIGLYRTEYEFIAAGRLLDEDDQVERYRRVQEVLDGRPVTYRLFDAGGDKPLPFLDFPDEENPALGWRGARLLLGMPELMRTQVRALARVSATGPVRVMYPMVTDVEQFRLLLSRFKEATADIDTGQIQHGVMFEVPSACLQAEALYEIADFGSIGSNDLIQYLFAVDRNNELVAADYSADAPVFWELLERLVAAAKKASKPLSICGEMAGDPVYIQRLLDCGLCSISVSSRLIPVSREIAVEMRSAGEQQTG